MAVSASILSWNIQIFGEIKISRLLRPNILSPVIVQRGADIVALQAPGDDHGSRAATKPIAAPSVRSRRHHPRFRAPAHERLPAGARHPELAP